MATPPKKTPPSSRVKKLPKEGSPKFIGPRSDVSLESEYITTGPGRRDHQYRGYKKRDQRAYEKENPLVSKRQSLIDVVADRIDQAKAMFRAPPGANRSTDRAAAAELIQAARKLQDPATREKVLDVIQKELSRYKPQPYAYRDEEIPF